MLNRFLKNLTTFHYITLLKSLLWSNGSTASTSTSLGSCLLSTLGLTSCNINFTCYLSEFSEVKSSNLFGFFNLLLVGLDLSLKSINQGLHALVILAVFIRCKCQLIYTSLRSTQVLQSIGFGFIQTLSHVLGLSFQNTTSFFHLLSNILF